MRALTIKSSDVARCRYRIWSPQHYRQDGTCRCNDLQAIEMVDWGYVWDSKHGQWVPA